MHAYFLTVVICICVWWSNENRPFKSLQSFFMSMQASRKYHMDIPPVLFLKFQTTMFASLHETPNFHSWSRSGWKWRISRRRHSGKTNDSRYTVDKLSYLAWEDVTNLYLLLLMQLLGFLVCCERYFASWVLVCDCIVEYNISFTI